MTDTSPFALFIRGNHEQAFAISDQLGFYMDMQALAVSVFEDGPASMHVQALYATEEDANAAQASLDLTGLEHFITQLPDEDWVAKSQAGLPPVQAGPFFVYGEHDKDKIPDDIAYPIQIDAGIAFGTGHHGTTKGCLLALEEYYTNCFESEEHNKFLDLGCGAGVLAIAAAMSLNKSIMASDIDPDSIEVTLENAKINNWAHRITAIQADGLNSQKLRENGPYDLVFANILAGPLLKMAPDIANSLANGGNVILSGILDEQADTMVSNFRNFGLQLLSTISLNGWTTLRMQRVFK